jgi:hypothetical protein
MIPVVSAVVAVGAPMVAIPVPAVTVAIAIIAIPASAAAIIVVPVFTMTLGFQRQSRRHRTTHHATDQRRGDDRFDSFHVSPLGRPAS